MPPLKKRSAAQKTRLSKNVMRKNRAAAAKKKKQGKTTKERRQLQRSLMAQIRKTESYKSKEAASQAVYNRSIERKRIQRDKIATSRTNPSFKAHEADYDQTSQRKQSQRVKIAVSRTNPLFKAHEASYNQSSQRKQSQRVKIAVSRTNPLFKAHEADYDQTSQRKQSQRVKIAVSRKNPSFKAHEADYDQTSQRKQSQRVKIAVSRTNPLFKAHEASYNQSSQRKQSQRVKIAVSRTNPLFKAHESVYNKSSQRKQNQRLKISSLRTTRSFKKRESVYNKTQSRKQRQKKKMAELRLNAWFKKDQREWMKRWRKNVFNRMLERATNARRMRIRRYDRYCRAAANRKFRYYMRRLRKNGLFREREIRMREKSKKIERKRKMLKRKLTKKQENDNHLAAILRFRTQFEQDLKRLRANGEQSEKIKANLFLKFIKDRSETPHYVCVSCEGLFFYHSVRKLDEDDINELRYEHSMFSTIYCCNTCYDQYRKGKTPTLKVTNGLEFPIIPDCIKQLTRLEERLVSPIVPFMQIRDLMPHALNPQLGIRGSVVNIPVKIPEMIQTLPRPRNQLQTIQLKFKRHLDHKSDFMCESINPARVSRALVCLEHTELYTSNKCVADQKYILDNLNNEELCDFIVEPDDELISRMRLAAVNPDDPNDPDSDSESSNADADADADDTADVKGNAEKDAANDAKPKKKAKKKKDDDFDFGDDDDVLLLDMNEEIAKNAIISIAPGQFNKPLPWLVYPNLDELCFPKIFCGQPFNTNNLSYSKRTKSELRRADRRSCSPTRVLFMAKQNQERNCLSSINVCLRKTTKDDLTVEQVMDENIINEMVQNDDAFRVLQNIRTSPAYWDKIRKNSFAMIRQLGKPTIFLTLSAAEKYWPELLQVLYKYQHQRDITYEEAMNLSDFVKTELIRKDPVLCAQYFEYKNNKFMRLLKQDNSVFGVCSVEDETERVEMQKRGSPHEHKMLWLKDAPQLDTDDMAQSEQRVVEFIDKYITCKNDTTIPYIVYQRHRHTYTCLKAAKGKKKKTCRFNLPLPMMPETQIIHPLNESERKGAEKEIVKGKKDFEAIKALMESLYKDPRELSFDEALVELKLTNDEYIYAIRCTIKQIKVFLKRGSLDVGINAYNRDILCLWEANIDIQFIIDEYAVAMYMNAYINKTDAGMSKLLRQAVADSRAGNEDLKQRFRAVANAFVNGSLLGAQEASYLNLSMPLSRLSREVTFINTGPIKSRYRMRKAPSDLIKLDKKSTNTVAPDIIDKYAAREGMDDLCLADFAAIKTERKRADGKIEYYDRERPRVIRYVRYSMEQDKFNFFREQCLLFFPWRNEKEDIENKNCATIYFENLELIKANQKKYVTIPEERIEEIFNDIERKKEANEDGEEDEEDKALRAFIEDCGERLDIDVFEQNDQTKPKKAAKEKATANTNRFFSPTKISEANLLSLLEILNPRQRAIVMNILKRTRCAPESPFHYFLSGAAGVGKSTVINAIYQLITDHFDRLAGANPDSIKVLLTAPSGKAAHLINGTTLHAAFALPVNQYGGQLSELSNDIANSIRVQLKDLKLLIIDEISMVGTKILHFVHQRLVQIFGKNEPFGGISVLVVGDLNQLAPVGDQKVFVPFRNPNNTTLGELIGPISPLWEHFEYYELTEIMRQKDETELIEALNHLAVGKMTDADINLIKSRKTDAKSVPEEAIRLFKSNDEVDIYNEKRIENAPGDKVVSTAMDRINEQVSIAIKNRTLAALKNKKPTDTYGMAWKISFKVGIRYMITTNIDIEDGIVNGACGVLKYIQFEEDNPSKPKTMFMEFDSNRVGSKARKEFKHNLGSEVNENWVPIKLITREISMSKGAKFQITRTQFPMKPAEALTIHKSQGSTCESICVHMAKGLTRELLYVALSRVTKLSNLYIVGDFKAPPAPKSSDPTIAEINRLKTQRPIKLCFNQLQLKTGLACGYQNVVSFPKYRKHIEKDEWYSKCDVLIFTETYTTSNYQVDWPNFDLILRTDDIPIPKPRGMFVFAKPNVKIRLLHHQVIESQPNENPVFHCDIAAFEIDEINLITGYKSPQTKDETFKNLLEDVVSKCGINSFEKTVLMGDFNIDSNERSTFLSTLLPEFSMMSKISPKDPTTKYNTHIDIVFANFDDIVAGTYETYFSDHKPIFFELRKPNDGDNYAEQIIPAAAPITAHATMLAATTFSTPTPIQTPTPAPNTPTAPTAPTTIAPVAQQLIVQQTVSAIDDQLMQAIQLGLLDEEFDQAEANEILRIAAPHVDEYIGDIETPHQELDIFTIDHFIEVIVRAAFPNYNMQPTAYVQRPQNYREVPLDRDDIQIILCNHHYVVSHQIAGNNQVLVYDSLCGRAGRVNDRNLRHQLEIFYPGRTFRRIPTATQQPDAVSCGVFAIATVVTLLLNGNPATYHLQSGMEQNEADVTMRLRRHLGDIFRTGQIMLFPPRIVVT